MEDKKQPESTAQKSATPPQVPKRPNEVGTLQIDSFVKIFDPNSQEIFVEKRA